MTNYTKSTDFSVKDVLLTGNPNKLVKGSEVNIEFANIELADATNVKKTGVTGSAVLPSGTTAQRDAAPSVGYERFNTTSQQMEVYTSTGWQDVGGAIGGTVDRVFFENDTTITSDYTITTGRNAGTFGPVTVSATVTVPVGSNWTIV